MDLKLKRYTNIELNNLSGLELVQHLKAFKKARLEAVYKIYIEGASYIGDVKQMLNRKLNQIESLTLEEENNRKEGEGSYVH
jgi:hypothetical protein